MRIGVLGTGMVGQILATKLVTLGHEVMMGSRTADNESAAGWVASTGEGASQGTFGDAAAFGELVVNCTAGAGSLEALGSARAEHLAGKTLLDVSNPLDFSQGMPPSLFVCNTDSVGEQIQRAFPDARVESPSTRSTTRSWSNHPRFRASTMCSCAETTRAPSGR